MKDGFVTLRALRVRCSYTQCEAADLLGISVPTLKKWENDIRKMPIGMLERCAKIYGWPKDKIYIGETQKGQRVKIDAAPEIA